jgi:phage tail sheath protein FI
MPEYLAPGVYVEEVSSGIKPIEGVSTSTAGFLGRTERGPAGAYLVTSFTEYQRLYGGFMSEDSMFLPGAVKGFFDNGGRRAFISRANKDAAQQAVAAVQEFTFKANGFGRWGNNVFVLVIPATRQPQGAGQNYRVIIAYFRRRPAVWVNPIAKPIDIIKLPFRPARPDFIEDFDNLTGPSDVENVINARSVLVTVKAPLGRAPTLSAVQADGVWQRWTRLDGGGEDPADESTEAAKAEMALKRATDALEAAVKMEPIVTALRKATDLSEIKRIAPDLSTSATAAAGKATAVATASADLKKATADAEAAAVIATTENNALKTEMVLATAKAKATTIAKKTREVADNAIKIIGTAPDSLVEKAALAASLAFSSADNADAVATMSNVIDDIKQAGNAATQAAVDASSKIKDLPADLASAPSAVSIETEKAKTQAEAAKKAADAIPSVATLADAKAKIEEASTAKDAAITAAQNAQKNARQAAASAAEKRDNAERTKARDDQPKVSSDFLGGEALDGTKTGLKALEEVDDISIVVAPEHVEIAGLDQELDQSCRRLADRVVLLSVTSKDQQLQPQKIAAGGGNIDSTFAAFYHPWIDVSDPAPTSVPPQPVSIPAIGHIAGILARTDITRGVHKAPANEVVLGALDLSVPVSKGQQDILNPKGVNCIRDFRADGRGIRLWGARTTSSDPEWKYLNVRRLFLFLEESIDEGTQWVVFEPNSDPTWAAVRRNISNFLLSVWRSGALLGTKPEEAFYVRCDRTTMTEDDILNGRLICVVGVAPVRPAEFVIIRISQMTAEAKS